MLPFTRIPRLVLSAVACEILCVMSPELKNVSIPPQRRAGRRRQRSVRTWLRALPRWQQAMFGALAAIVAVAVVVGAVLVVTHQVSVKELRDRQAHIEKEYGFNPGLLISDEKFFDASSMNTRQIQDFLTQHGNKCSSSQCLKNAAFPVSSQKADQLCAGYSGKGKKSGAEILQAVSSSCGISPKVLLVMLEKEQGLVSTAEPTATKFDWALGLSCPDTAACDRQYKGFFKQVYGAAHRFKYYQANPDEYSYQADDINYVKYSPEVGCGGTQIYIENEATALLYIYTPYQPDETALKAGWGTGGRCSSYGNRNFVKLYKAWFG